MLCNAIGLPLKFILTRGEAHDSPLAVPFLEGELGSHVIERLFNRLKNVCRSFRIGSQVF